MDYKEKYKKALCKAKKYHQQLLDEDNPEWASEIEEIFPELKESEDERIRKWCIKLIKATCDYDSPTSRKEVDDAIAWLEKQGESNPYSGVSFNYNGDIWGMCARDNGVDILFNKKLIQHVSNREQNEPKPQGKSAIEAIKEEKVDNQNCVKPTDKVDSDAVNLQAHLITAEADKVVIMIGWLCWGIDIIIQKSK